MKAADPNTLIATLEQRFEANLDRHKGIDWRAVQARLDGDARVLEVLLAMERTGGEPDVVGFDKKTDRFTFMDCAAESPEGRRALCYDRAALDARKKNKPAGSAMEMAASLGVEMLTEAEYRQLQALGPFDTKTSSWVKTPPEIRDLGGALFCDHRFGQVFVYHNGAESYYAARGFRGRVSV